MPYVADENDQAEIETRAKLGMYLEAVTKLDLTYDQKNNIKLFPFPDVNASLCNLCKILTCDQMKKISAQYYKIKWPHITLYDWHLKNR
jgi:hypothetical protein